MTDVFVTVVISASVVAVLSMAAVVTLAMRMASQLSSEADRLSDMAKAAFIHIGAESPAEAVQAELSRAAGEEMIRSAAEQDDDDPHAGPGVVTLKEGMTFTDASGHVHEVLSVPD